MWSHRSNDNNNSNYSKNNYNVVTVLIMIIIGMHTPWFQKPPFERWRRQTFTRQTLCRLLNMDPGFPALFIRGHDKNPFSASPLGMPACVCACAHTYTCKRTPTSMYLCLFFIRMDMHSSGSTPLRLTLTTRVYTDLFHNLQHCCFSWYLTYYFCSSIPSPKRK